MNIIIAYDSGKFQAIYEDWSRWPKEDEKVIAGRSKESYESLIERVANDLMILDDPRKEFEEGKISFRNIDNNLIGITNMYFNSRIEHKEFSKFYLQGEKTDSYQNKSKQSKA